MIGVILAGGRGTRLKELTRAVNKSLLPLGDEPIICHQIRKLVGAGVEHICVTTGTERIGQLVDQLGSGSRYGCVLTYKVQEGALGIAHALGLWVGVVREKCVVVLGDNVFEDDLTDFVIYSDAMPRMAVVAVTEVSNPEAFGNIMLHPDGKGIRAIVEKPKVALSPHIVAGIYSYPPDVFNVIAGLVPSARGEYEITDVNNHYLSQGRLVPHRLHGYWIDAGTPENYRRANQLAGG